MPDSNAGSDLVIELSGGSPITREVLHRAIKRFSGFAKEPEDQETVQILIEDSEQESLIKHFDLWCWHRDDCSKVKTAQQATTTGDPAAFRNARCDCNYERVRDRLKSVRDSDWGTRLRLAMGEEGDRNGFLFRGGRVEDWPLEREKQEDAKIRAGYTELGLLLGLVGALAWWYFAQVLLMPLGVLLGLFVNARRHLKIQRSRCKATIP